jgi:glycosyltransferase involved in cell wall biosynthesis
VRVVVDGKMIGVVAFAHLVQEIRALSIEIIQRRFVVHSFLGFGVAHIKELHDAMMAQSNVYWLHDYSSICEGYTLMRNDLEFCHAPNAGAMACRVCVYGRERQRHLTRVLSIFTHCRFAVVAPSEFTLKLWLARSHLPYESTWVHPHWTLKAKTNARHRSPGPLRVAFLGLPIPGKGWPMFQTLSEQLQFDDRYLFYHFAARNKKSTMAAIFVCTEVTEKSRNAAVSLLTEHAIDIVVVASPWPETFSYVAHEAIAAGCMIICLHDSGNVAALAASTGRGLSFADPDDVAEFFSSGAAVDWIGGVAQTTYQVVNCGTTATLALSESVSAAAE